MEVATFAGIRAARTYSGKCCHTSDFFSRFGPVWDLCGTEKRFDELVQFMSIKRNV